MEAGGGSFPRVLRRGREKIETRRRKKQNEKKVTSSENTRPLTSVSQNWRAAFQRQRPPPRHCDTLQHNLCPALRRWSGKALTRPSGTNETQWPPPSIPPPLVLPRGNERCEERWDRPDMLSLIRSSQGTRGLEEALEEGGWSEGLGEGEHFLMTATAITAS